MDPELAAAVFGMDVQRVMIYLADRIAPGRLADEGDQPPSPPPWRWWNAAAASSPAAQPHSEDPDIRTPAYPAGPGTGLGVAQLERQAAEEQRPGRPQGEYAEALPGGEGEAAEVGGGLDGQAGAHRADLLQVA